MATSRKLPSSYNESTFGAEGYSRDYTSLSTWEAATDNNLTIPADADYEGGTSSGDRAENYVVATKITVTQTDDAHFLGIRWGDTDAGYVRLALYSHDSGNDKPDSLLVETDSTEIQASAGWQYIAIDSTSVTPGTYWLCYNLDITGADTRKTIYHGTGKRHYAVYTYGAMPSTFPSSTSDTVEHSVMIVYNENSTGQGEVLTCASGIHADSVTIAGATVSSDYFRVIRATSANRGTRDDGARFVVSTSGDTRIIQVQEDYAGIYDIAVKVVSSDNIAIAFDSRNYYTKFVGCTAYDVSSGGSRVAVGFNLVRSGTSGNVVVNCYAYNCDGANAQNAGYRFYTGDGNYIYNSIATDCKNGIYALTTTVQATNCIFQDNTSDVTGSTINQTDCSVDEGIGFEADGYHLDPDDANTQTYAIDQGTDLSADGNYAFDDDIDGDTRGGTWDIGCDEAGGVPIIVPRRRAAFIKFF